MGPTGAPKLRMDIEVIPAEYKGQKGIIVKDFIGLIKQPVFLREDILDVLRLIDGKRTVLDIQLELIRLKRGVFVSSEEVQRLLVDLDSSFLLDSERYVRAKQRIFEEYAALPVRKPHLSGSAYPESAAELNNYLEGILNLDGVQHPEQGMERIRVLVAPHIDLEVGKRVYALAYHLLREAAPKRVLLLGTGHQLREAYFALTDKDFETPLGLVRTDKECVRRLRTAGQRVVASDDFVHRSEHSLEFQLLFLQHLCGSDFALVPLLCGAFDRELGTRSSAREIPHTAALFEALGQIIDEEPATLVVAGVDLSHIGPKFGHPQSASALLPESKAHDQRLLNALCAGDGSRFWAEVKSAQNKYNVCGFSPLCCVLELFPSAEGRLLGYDIWQERPTKSAVSFAAVAIADSLSSKSRKEEG